MDTKFCVNWKGDEKSKYCRYCAKEGDACYVLWQIVRRLAAHELVIENYRPGKAYGNRYRLECPKSTRCTLQMLQGQRSAVGLPIEDFLYVTRTGRGGPYETPSGTRLNPFVDLLLEIIADDSRVLGGADAIAAVREIPIKDEIYDDPREWVTSLKENDLLSGSQFDVKLEPNAQSWITALNQYSYPVQLSNYERRSSFPEFFSLNIKGDRNSTTEFENYFRINASKTIVVYFEVVFWKLYSTIVKWQKAKWKYGQKNPRETLDNIVDYILQSKLEPTDLLRKIEKFTSEPSLLNLQDFRSLIGLKRDNGSLAIALTFPAFWDPLNFPMVDRNVAEWVNSNLTEHDQNRQFRLTMFKNQGKTLQDNDFPNYLNWVNWCRETASRLTIKTTVFWRARDVEMAMFATQHSGLKLKLI